MIVTGRHPGTSEAAPSPERRCTARIIGLLPGCTSARSTQPLDPRSVRTAPGYADGHGPATASKARPRTSCGGRRDGFRVRCRMAFPPLHGDFGNRAAPGETRQETGAQHARGRQGSRPRLRRYRERVSSPHPVKRSTFTEQRRAERLHRPELDYRLGGKVQHRRPREKLSSSPIGAHIDSAHNENPEFVVHFATAMSKLSISLPRGKARHFFLSASAWHASY